MVYCVWQICAWWLWWNSNDTQFWDIWPSAWIMDDGRTHEARQRLLRCWCSSWIYLRYWRDWVWWANHRNGIHLICLYNSALSLSQHAFSDAMAGWVLQGRCRLGSYKPEGCRKEMLCLSHCFGREMNRCIECYI